MEAYSRSRAAAERALRLDPDLAEAHASLARVLTAFYWETDRADWHFRRAVELNPRDAGTRHMYASHLRNVGRLADARAQVEAALALDPLAFQPHYELVVQCFFERRYGAAIEKAEQLAVVDESYPMLYFMLGKVRAERGEHEAALEDLDRSDPHRRFPRP